MNVHERIAHRRMLRHAPRPASPPIIGRATLLCGDARELLASLPSNSIDGVVTDPPYALVSIVKRFGNPDYQPAKGNQAFVRASRGFMGQTWDNGTTAHDPAFWHEVLRVVKPGGYVLAFGGTRTYHRLACAIEDAGFEVRDMVQWLYGSGFPKSHDVSKGIDKAAGVVREVGTQYIAPDGKPRGVDLGIQGGSYAAGNSNYVAEKLVTAPATDDAREWQGWGTALKPACEPICMARKALSEETVAANVLRWGTGAINIDGCRVDAADKTPAPVGQFVGSTIGPNGHTGIRNGSSDALGRWPANVITDGSDEVVAAFPNSNGGGDIHRRSSPKTKNIYGEFAGDDDRWSGYGDSGSAARFFYQAKATKKERAGSKHPTVKPISLNRCLCRLIIPPGGLVLDPFAGTGTLGAAAHHEGMRSVMIEREANYQDDIRRRMAALNVEVDNG